MAGWKDDLRKIKRQLNPALDTKNNSEKHKVQRSEESSESSWKKGVKPLSKKKQSTSVKSSKKRKRNKNKSKQKRKQKSKTNYEPSIQAILGAYGPDDVKQIKPVTPLKKQYALPEYKDLPNVVLSNAEEYKVPDQWVKNGIYAQPPGCKGGRMLSVRIGIDFGTSYTKVALRAAGQVFFIDWEGVRKGRQKYFLPGEVALHPDGSISLGRSPKMSEAISGLKLPFLSDDESNDRFTAAIAFLALVIRYVRGWLYHNHKSMLVNRRLSWEINIGAPTDPWTKSKIVNRYKYAMYCAWALSIKPNNITMEASKNIIKNRNIIEQATDLDDVFVLPEFVAELAGHVNSNQRQEGLHLLVDVGAGTVDLAAFNIYKIQEEDRVRFPVLSGTVVPLGTHVLTAYRLAPSKSTNLQWNDIDTIPSTEHISTEFDIDITTLNNIDAAFIDMLSSETGKLLGYTKNRRYSTAPEWKRGLRVFLVGGGSGCKIYKDGIDKAFGMLKTRPIYVIFPIHESVQGSIKEKIFHRMAVAFGLTYDHESIGKIIPPQNIPDMHQSRTRATLPRHEDLYSD